MARCDRCYTEGLYCRVCAHRYSWPMFPSGCSYCTRGGPRGKIDQLRILLSDLESQLRDSATSLSLPYTSRKRKWKADSA